MIDFKGSHFESEIILLCVRWYLAYPLSYRNLEEMMDERGVSVDHSTINRWVLKYTPALVNAFRKRKKPVSRSWRMDETYVRVKGQWKYLYCAVDKEGHTIDFLLTAQRDRHAAKRFLNQAVKHQGRPEKINIDKSGANAAGIRDYNKETESAIRIQPSKYKNNRVEQDHRFIKRRTRPMLGFKAFRSAKITLAGIEVMHMIRKGQMKRLAGKKQTPAAQFYSRAA